MHPSERYGRLVFVLLPPSETKASGGDLTPLVPSSLSFPELADTRELLLDRLITISGHLPTARTLIGVPASLDYELTSNVAIRTGPTMPAISRYTGVLYEALDISGMSRSERVRAGQRLAITSALFGMLRPDDLIPGYRMSASSKLTGTATLSSIWRGAFARAAAQIDGPVIDLRSGAYAAFGAFPGAITVRVVTESVSGQRQVVSHFNKHTKGLLARALAVTRATVTDLPAVLRVARRAGLRAERNGPAGIEIVS